MSFTGVTLPPLRANEGLEQLIASYLAAERNLEDTIRAAAQRGAAGTSIYYRMQLLRVQAEVNRLQAQAVPLARRTVAGAYLGGAGAVDKTLGVELAPWAGIDRGAMNRLAAALAAPLQKMSITVGRQAADAYRKAGLTESALGVASGRPRRDTSRAIADRLARQGVTGFVDRTGRRWALSTYASMVARTTTREAVTQGTVDRMGAHNLDLVTISEHDGSCEICAPYEGNTYSLSGDTPGYDVADDLPPYHPNCDHVAYPAAAEFDDWLDGLNGDLDAG